MSESLTEWFDKYFGEMKAKPKGESKIKCLSCKNNYINIRSLDGIDLNLCSICLDKLFEDKNLVRAEERMCIVCKTRKVSQGKSNFSKCIRRNGMCATCYKLDEWREDK